MGIGDFLNQNIRELFQSHRERVDKSWVITQLRQMCNELKSNPEELRILGHNIFDSKDNNAFYTHLLNYIVKKRIPHLKKILNEDQILKGTEIEIYGDIHGFRCNICIPISESDVNIDSKYASTQTEATSNLRPEKHHYIDKIVEHINDIPNSNIRF